MDIKNKKVLIVGFGRSGQAAAKYCLAEGAVVTVTDTRPEKEFNMSEFRSSFAQRAQDDRALRGHFGSNPIHLFTEADIVIPSPGVPLNIEGLKKARAKNIRIIGEMELVADKLKAPVIAIAGTNGKSTVTTLIGEILKEAGKKVLVGGNLGTPLIELLHEAKENKNIDFIVLEVSSYQLEISPTFHPYIALLLNITPDHLDRYSGMQSYIDAKALIIKNLTKNDHFIFNEEDELVRDIAKRAAAKKTGFTSETRTVDLSQAKITGLHNKENMTAAALAATIAGCSKNAIEKVFERFRGLPHRNQFVREVKGIKFYDDSKGTNVGAVVKSLEGFDSKVVLIAGGLDKGGSYEPLKPLMKEKVRTLILIGAAKDIIAKALGDVAEIVMAENMADAVKKAFSKAKEGDAVLLSPACASFDMFKDYADRGNKFAEEVNKLK